MNTNDLELFKKRLLDKKNLLLLAIKKSMDTNRQSHARLSFELVKDNPDRSVDELLKHVDAHVLGSKGDELEVIESALQKISEGTYGTCEMCGTTIAPERLQVYPEAICCVACQGRREHMDRFTPDQKERPEPPGTEAYLDDDE